MMAAAVELMFIAGYAVVESDFAGQAALCQQFERAIDGGKPNFWIFRSDQTEKFVGGKMIAGFQEGAQNGIALFGVLQPYALQVLEKNVLRFTHGFACRWGMIVNSPLQHVGSQLRGTCPALASEARVSLNK